MNRRPRPPCSRSVHISWNRGPRRDVAAALARVRRTRTCPSWCVRILMPHRRAGGRNWMSSGGMHILGHFSLPQHAMDGLPVPRPRFAHPPRVCTFGAGYQVSPGVEAPGRLLCKQSIPWADLALLGVRRGPCRRCGGRFGLVMRTSTPTLAPKVAPSRPSHGLKGSRSVPHTEVADMYRSGASTPGKT